MKELSVEEKAKRYDEAILSANLILDMTSDKSAIYTIFPELEEKREDERIRKWLLHYFAEVCDNVSEKEKKGVLDWIDKQGEQKPWSEEDKKMLKWITGYLENRMLNTPIGEERTACKNAIVWLKNWKIEQKPAWSEEDKKIINEIEESLLAYKIIVIDNDRELANYIEKEINWLKSLKDRVQPQLQQEWGEEDEKCIRLSTDIIDSALRAGFCVQLDRDRCIDWLKSLRPQKQWKPSEEQMYNLSEAAHYNCAFFDMEILKGLYDDLKQL